MAFRCVPVAVFAVLKMAKKMTHQSMERSSRKLGGFPMVSALVTVSRRTCGTQFAGQKAKAVLPLALPVAGVLAVAFVLLARQKN